MNNIVFEHVVKAYGKNVIVNDLNMEIREGERLILLGPSGCGKSTTLRMIATPLKKSLFCAKQHKIKYIYMFYATIYCM